MNKLVRVLGLGVLVALAFGSCKKNETNTFKASTVKFDSDSKTHLDGGYSMLWDNGDVITVFKHDDPTHEAKCFVGRAIDDGEAAIFHVYDGDGDFMSDLNNNDSYSAYYPNPTYSGNEVRLAIPKRQVHRGDNFHPNTFPMYGWNEGGEFSFDTDAGLLFVPIKRGNGSSEDDYKIDSLVLRTETTKTVDNCIAGDFVYHNDVNHNETGQGQFDGQGNTITLVCPQTALIPAGEGNSTTFSFILPDGSLNNGFILVGYYDGDTVFHRKAQNGNSCTINKKQIRKMKTSTLPM